MGSPLVRVIAAIFSGYLIILLVMAAYDWVAEEFPRRPPASSHPDPVRHGLAARRAAAAMQRFARLPAAEQTAVKANLTSRMLTVSQWLARLERADVQLLCMGEYHRESTRRFLAERFFAAMDMDTLLLEATPEQLDGLLRRMAAGRDYFPLLDADIMAILRSATRRNPRLRIRGIEETAGQAADRLGGANSRDRSIADNFWAAFEPGRRHVILFGALHCTTDSNWLFDNLMRQASPALQAAMRNVRVVGEHQHGAVEALVAFLDGIDLRPGDFVIPDNRTLHPLIRRCFPRLDAQILQKYRVLVVFRSF